MFTLVNFQYCLLPVAFVCMKLSSVRIFSIIFPDTEVSLTSLQISRSSSFERRDDICLFQLSGTPLHHLKASKWHQLAPSALLDASHLILWTSVYPIYLSVPQLVSSAAGTASLSQTGMVLSGGGVEKVFIVFSGKVATMNELNNKSFSIDHQTIVIYSCPRCARRLIAKIPWVIHFTLCISLVRR